VSISGGSTRARVILFVLGCVLSAVAVVVALRGIDLDAAVRIIRSAAPAWLAAAVAILAVQTLVRGTLATLLPVEDGRARGSAASCRRCSSATWATRCCRLAW
jgi:uncharacterized membrane protein YbhN (UPF0104 family)